MIEKRRSGARQDGEGMMLPGGEGLPDRYVSEPEAESPAFRRSLEMGAQLRRRRMEHGG